MKTIRILVLAVLVLGLSSCAQNVAQQAYGPEQSVSLQVFYTELSPYGRWVDYSPHGYVWIPDVSPQFSPYLTEGHWVYTRYGWTWYSYYPWGWAPFHYGRWHYDVAFGWMWLPDTIWAPAWVAWRRGGGYCGWAPLDIGVTVQIVIADGYHVPHEHWIFVRDRDLQRSHVHRHRVDRSRNNELVETVTITRQVREERSAMYMPGPDKDDITRTGKRPVREVQVRERTSPGATRLGRDHLEVYKPEIRKETPQERKAAPPRVYQPREIEKPSERENRDRHDVNRPRTREPVQQPERRREIRPRVIEKETPGRTGTEKKTNGKERSTRGRGEG